MGEFVKVAKVSDIEDKSGLCVEVGDKRIAIFNLTGEFHAIDDECSHAGGPLSEGVIEGEEVECPWHDARFNIKTGKACCEPAEDAVARYSVRIRGDDIEVEL